MRARGHSIEFWKLYSNYKILSIIHSIFQTHKEVFGERLCSSDEPLDKYVISADVR
jgi:hypothetical protein